MATQSERKHPMTNPERIDRLEKSVASLAVRIVGPLDRRFWLQNPELRSLVEEVSEEEIVL
jgi:hypothetical protein